MSKRRAKARAAKKSPARRMRKAQPKQAGASQLELEALDGSSREPSPEELRELEVSVERDQQRVKQLGLAQHYPRRDGALVEPLTAALRAIAGVNPVQARLVAQAMKRVGDKAHDLDEIIDRILHEKHDPKEIAELVMAFQLLTEQICSYADGMGEKLYEVFDRAKGLK